MGTITQKRSVNQNPVVQNGVLGMLLFLATEIMFFGGLISGFIVNRSENLGAWPPPWQPRLPVEFTAFNTLLLLVSGVTMYLVVKEIRNNNAQNKQKVNSLLKLTMVLGIAFVALQGREWVNLLVEGMTVTSSLFGAFFYTIIGTHALHVSIGLIYLITIAIKIIKTDDVDYMLQKILPGSIYWYFVVGIWPVLYVMVYLV